MYPPKDDLVFQSLFKKGNERITKALIEAITNEKIETIDLEQNTDLLRDFRSEKGGRLDFKATLNNGQICHIDMQLKENGDEEQRFLEYWSRIYSTQLDKGDNYKELKKVISILILGYNYKKTKKIKDIVTKWKIKEDKCGKLVLTDDFEMYIIEIPKAKEVLKKEPNNKLAQWMCFFDNPEKEEVSKIVKTNKEIEEAMKKLEEVNSDKELKRILEIRRRNELEKNTEIRNARDEGIMQGIEQGIEQGMKQGKIQEKLDIAKNMKQKGFDTKAIAEITGLTMEEIEKL